MPTSPGGTPCAPCRYVYFVATMLSPRGSTNVRQSVKSIDQFPVTLRVRHYHHCPSKISGTGGVPDDSRMPASERHGVFAGQLSEELRCSRNFLDFSKEEASEEKSSRLTLGEVSAQSTKTLKNSEISEKINVDDNGPQSSTL